MRFYEKNPAMAGLELNIVWIYIIKRRIGIIMDILVLKKVMDLLYLKNVITVGATIFHSKEMMDIFTVFVVMPQYKERKENYND